MQCICYIIEYNHVPRPAQDVTIFEQISQQETSVSTMVYPDGSVIMSVPRVTRVGCSMNLTDYPFDR